MSSNISASNGLDWFHSMPFCRDRFFIARLDSSTNSDLVSIPLSITSALACPPTRIANRFLDSIKLLAFARTPASLASMSDLIRQAE